MKAKKNSNNRNKENKSQKKNKTTKKDSNKDKFGGLSEIEYKLYLIKQNKFICDTEFIKTNKFEFTVTRGYSENNKYVLLDEEEYHIHPTSRIIYFIDDKKTIKKFIYSFNNFELTLNSLNFKYFMVEEENSESDSIDSEISNKEKLRIFNDEKINRIIKIQSNLEKIVEKFNQRYSSFRNVIFGLSLNASFYYPNNKNDYLDLSLFNDNSSKFDTFMIDEKVNVLYFVGPKGTSKSLFLMDYCFEQNREDKVPSLYINYRIMKDLTSNENKNIFKKEMIYLFFKEESLKFFYKEKHYKNIKGKSIMNFIYEFIYILLKEFKNTFERRMTVIIDNFDEDNVEEVKYLEKLIELAIFGENIEKIKLILSGRCAFINGKIKLYLDNKIDLSHSNKHQALFYYNIKLNERKDIKSLPLYFYRLKSQNNSIDLEKEIIREEQILCEKYNLYGMYYSLIHCEKEISASELLNIFDILPCDLLVFNKNGNNNLSFDFHNNIFKLAVKNYIRFSIETQMLSAFLNHFGISRTTYGIFEEKLLTLFLSYNKIELNDLNFEDSNRLEVEEIYEFNSSSYEKTEKTINKNKSIIICQNNYLGKFYDLLILVPTILLSLNAYFIQMGTNKNKKQIDTIKNDIEVNEKNYKNGLEKFIDCKINKIELIFIFDKKTQINEAENKNFAGSIYCITNKINFYLFSIDDYLLYKTYDMKIFNRIISFENPLNKIKRNYNELKINIIKNLLSEKEIDLISEKINYNIESCDVLLLDEKIKGIPKDLKNELTYILQAKDNDARFYIIKKEIYYLENNILKKIDKKKYINKNEDYFVFMLSYGTNIFSKSKKFKSK